MKPIAASALTGLAHTMSHGVVRRLAIFLVVLPVQVSAQTFTVTGNMHYARWGHQATLLLDGRVLVTGGAGKSGEPLARAEVFSPATGSWDFAGDTVTPRRDHAAVLLQDGRVLIVGGDVPSASCSAHGTAELYDPATGAWSPAPALPMVAGSGLIAIRLLNGRVLVSGGGNRCGDVFNMTAVFDPSTNTWSATTPMLIGRQSHRAMLLSDGRVLVAGGTRTVDSGSMSVEVFSPETATWKETVGPFDAVTPSQIGALDTGRTLATMTVLATDKVLTVGGYDETHALLATADILDPVAGTWTRVDRLSIPRAGHTATRLANGIGVLIAGGIDALGPSASTEWFHPIPELPYEAAPVPVPLMGRPGGIASNSKNHLFVSFVRDDGRSRIFEYTRWAFPVDRSPEYYARGFSAFGEEFDGEAHTLRIDKDDNVWVVITETNTLLKFSPDGRLLMRLFPPPEPPDIPDDPPAPSPVEGLSDTPPPPAPYRFNRPTDVGWDAAGNIFVADGHRNSRIVKYSKSGRFLAAVGSRGSAPGEMHTPHSMVVDAAGNVYVADGANARIQVFDNSLNLRAIYDNVGNPWALCITEGPHQYLYSASNLFRRDEPPRGFWKGEIYKMELDGTILGRVGYADNASRGIRPANLLDCRHENEIIASGWGFKLILNVRP